MALTIWISSFIPGTIAGYTKPVPGAPGQTMIPGPLPVSDCYHTDQRGFTASPSASSRTRSSVDISDTDFSLLAQSHHCGNTVECDCEDGERECDQAASTANLKVLDFHNSASGCTFRFEGGAGNPCATGAPEINWSVRVAVKKTGTKVEVALAAGSLVEPFPAFEMYARVGGTTKAIFTRLPDPGATPWDLFGDPDRPVSGLAVF